MLTGTIVAQKALPVCSCHFAPLSEKTARRIVSVFVNVFNKCLTRIALQEARDCLFEYAGVVKQTCSKAKTQSQTKAKNIL